ncbi:MAG: mechanosensitive ion channel [Polyangiales bacterium]
MQEPAVVHTIDSNPKVWHDIQSIIDFRIVHVAGVNVTVGRLALALLVLVCVWFVSRIVRRALTRFAASHNDISPATVYTVSRLINYSFLAGAILLAMDAVGVPIGRFAVLAGGLGVGLGFGLQAIFNNFISGLILLFDRSLKVGDFIELDGDVRGTVRAINIRFTRVTTNDEIDLLVPNSDFITKRVVSWTYGSLRRRVKVPFGVAYGTDKELVKKAALEAASQCSFTLAMEGEHAPHVWLMEFGDSSVNYELVVWVNELGTRHGPRVTAAYMWHLDTALNAHGIEIPFPQRDILSARSLFGLQGDAALAQIESATKQPPTLAKSSNEPPSK